MAGGTSEGAIMRRMTFMLLLAGACLVLGAGPAMAATASPVQQGDEADDGTEEATTDVADLFSWISETDEDWATGGFYALLGLVGATVVNFGLIGGAVPGTAGKAKIDADETRIEQLSKRVVQLAEENPVQADALTAIDGALDKLRDDARRERWRQYVIASALYAFLGAFFASMLAKDLIQALAIGAGWTGILGSLGLRSDFSARKAAKDEAITDVVAELQVQVAKPAAAAPDAATTTIVDNAMFAQAL
jgi:hypothetical protein